MAAEEFRRLINIMENQERPPQVDYEMVGKTKAKTQSGEFDKIIARVGGSTSAKFTKLAKKFKELDALEKETKKLKDAANKEARAAMDELFEPEHAVLTRVAETKAIVLQLAKDVLAGEKEEEYLDVRNFVREVYDLVGKDLYWALSDIYKAHKKIRKIATAGRRGALTIKTLEMKEDADQDQVENITDLVDQITNKRMAIVDSKLDDLKTKYNLA